MASTALLLALGCATACGVPRVQPRSIESVDSTTLPNLRRSQEALQDLLDREREHVGALNLQISELRAQEGRLNEILIESEHDYLLLEDDLAAVQEERLAVQAEIREAREAVRAATTQLKSLQDELIRVQAQRVQVEAAIATLHGLVERGQVALDGLPPAMRLLIQQEMARVAAERARAAGTPPPASDPPPEAVPPSGSDDAPGGN